MIIESMTVGHFRCIENCDISLGPYVAIVGANGVGKSTILEAIRFFLDPDFRLTVAQANVFNPDAPLSVTMRLSDLTDGERESWPGASAADVLEIRKTASKDAAGNFAIAFHGKVSRHEAFDALYADYEGNKTVFRGNYNTFRAAHGDYSLPNVTKADDAMAEMQIWEVQNPEQCVVKEVPLDVKLLQALLYDAFRVVYVPAVSPAEDTLVGRGSDLSELINQMLWPSVLARPELLALQEKTRETFREIFPTEGSTELDAAQELINKSLGLFAPGTSLQLGWKPESFPKISPPEYQTVVIEDGVSNDVTLKGHGVQRALVVSVLNALNDDNNARHPTEDGVSLAPTTVLIVEEPELYQHPTRARHFARALNELASTGDGKPRMQIVLSTHSPYFVSVAKFDAIRVVRREATAGEHGHQRRVSMATLAQIAEGLRKARNYAANSNDEKAMLARLGTLMSTDVREGFFADRVVLTEGGSDVAAIQAALKLRGVDTDAAGIAVLDASGKGTLDKLWLIFDALAIPVYMLFDGDASKPKEAMSNVRLLTLAGAKPEGSPATAVGRNYAVFEECREATLLAEFGPEYDRLVEEACAANGYDRPQGEKVASIVAEVYGQLHAAGHRSLTLEAICDAISVL